MTLSGVRIDNHFLLYFVCMTQPVCSSVCLFVCLSVSVCLCLSVSLSFFLFICLIGIVLQGSTSSAKDPVFESRLRRDFTGSSHTSDFKIGTPVVYLPDAWRYEVSAGTGWPGVRIL